VGPAVVGAVAGPAVLGEAVGLVVAGAAAGPAVVGEAVGPAVVREAAGVAVSGAAVGNNAVVGEAAMEGKFSDGTAACCAQSFPLIGCQWQTGASSIPGSQAAKCLGCWECLANNKKQQEVLTNKCSSAHAKAVACRNISWQEAWMFCRSVCEPGVGFPLPMCCFTKAESDKMQVKPIPALATWQVWLQLQHQESCGIRSHQMGWPGLPPSP
jgi:hypothetical protein